MKSKYKIAKFLIRALALSWRITVIGEAPQSPAVVAFWHGAMLPVWTYFKRKNAYAMVSESKDGEKLADLLRSWGYEFVRGSSSKSGKNVLDQALHRANHNFLLMTPDGPRGPRQRFKPGAAVISHRTGVPLYLCKVDVKSKFVFSKSWDKFEAPYPFSKIILEFSEPINVDASADRDEIDGIIKFCEKRMRD